MADPFDGSKPLALLEFLVGHARFLAQTRRYIDRVSSEWQKSEKLLKALVAQVDTERKELLELLTDTRDLLGSIDAGCYLLAADEDRLCSLDTRLAAAAERLRGEER
jgi:hypothetical protein